jgi:hypothetical protein
MAIKTEPKGPKPPMPGLVKVQMLYNSVLAQQTLTAANVLHVITTPVVSQTVTSLTSLATSFYNAWGTRFITSLGNTANLIGCNTTDLSGTGLQGSYLHTTPGGASGASIAPQCAIVITWKAAINWRGGRPRTYLPFVPNNALPSASGSKLQSTFTSALATAAQNFLVDVNGITLSGSIYQLGVPSYYTKGNFRPAPVFYAFQSAVVHDRLDSQRRRSGKESQFLID